MKKFWLSRQNNNRLKEALFPVLLIVLIYNLLVIGAIQFILNTTPAWKIHIQREGVEFSFREPFSNYMKRLSIQGGSSSWKPDSDQLTGVAYVKIAQLEGVELPQQVFLFILNQEGDGLSVESKLEIPTSVILPAEKGVHYYYFPEPVKLAPGNSYAQWQQADLPLQWLPFLIKIGSIDGFSTTKLILNPESIENNDFIDDAVITWRRSYYVVLSPAPKQE